MARKRSTTALYEVISRTRASRPGTGFDVPGWMGGAEMPPEGVPKAPEVPGAWVSDRQRGPQPQSVRQEPMVSMGGQRLNLSLNYVTAGVVAVGLLILLLGAFALGRATAPGGGPPVENQPADAGYRAGVIQGPPGSPAGPNGPKRVPGKFYLVIQTLVGFTTADMAEAERIVEFCKQRGEPADIVKGKIGGRMRYAVWSFRPFDGPDKLEALQYARKIQELGQEYFRKHRTYDFRQRNRDGEFEPYYVQAKDAP